MIGRTNTNILNLTIISHTGSTIVNASDGDGALNRFTRLRLVFTSFFLLHPTVPPSNWSARHSASQTVCYLEFFSLTFQ